jgi:hypothetical protein
MSGAGFVTADPSSEVVHSEATEVGFEEQSKGTGFGNRRGKFSKPTFASMRAAVPTLATTKQNQTTEILVQKGAQGYGFALASSTAEMPFGMCHYISRVDAGGEAEAAGVVVGNRIIEVEGTPVKGSTHEDLMAALKKHSGYNLPLKLGLAPVNELVRLSLAGKIKDGDLFVRDNMRDVTGIDAKDVEVWRSGQKCYIADWEGGSLAVTILVVKRGEVGKVDVRIIETEEVRTVLFTDLQREPDFKKTVPAKEEEGTSDEGGEDEEEDEEDDEVGEGISPPTTPATKELARQRLDSMSNLKIEPGFGSDDDEEQATKPGAGVNSGTTNALASAPSSPPANTSASAAALEHRAVGDKCWALYEPDDMYYAAIIVGMHPDAGTVVVEFDEFKGERHTISGASLTDASNWDPDGKEIVEAELDEDDLGQNGF